jgi:hypothetical protein
VLPVVRGAPRWSIGRFAAIVKTPAQNFTGDVYLTPIFNRDATTWLEPVTDQQYTAANSAANATA